MTRALLCFAALVPLLAQADADPKFAKLRDSAEALSGLGSFLDKYVGECALQDVGGAECKQNAAAFRQAATGRKFYMIIAEEAATQLSMGPMNGGGTELSLNVTPFFPGSNSAVTQGAPSHTDGAGNPVLPFLVMRGQAPQGKTASDVARLLSMRALRMQVIFTPQGLWTLPKKGGGKIQGVKARIDAVLVTVGRTGEQVALWVAR